MNRRSFIAGLAAFAVAPALSAPAQAAVWNLIGTRRVRWFVDSDTIFVGTHRGKFRSIRLRVHGNGVHFHSLRVIFGNGASQNIAVRSFIPAGGQTRVIDLNGGERFISQVRMTYSQPLFFGPTATVEVWGRR